jgi:hypothetical protein
MQPDGISLESWWLFALFLGGILLIDEVGHVIGLRLRTKYDPDTRDQLGSLQAGTLGLTGLILGFAFSLALSRFDQRRELVIEEANALGTTYLRADLLRNENHDDAKRILRRYVNSRVELFEQRHQPQAVRRLMTEAERMHVELWKTADRATREDARPVVSLYVTAVNQVLDLHTSRRAALAGHIPVMVLVVLFVFTALGLGTVAYASAVRCGRRLSLSFVLALLMSALLLVIIDLDRPIHGVIPVNQDAMYYLRATL